MRKQQRRTVRRPQTGLQEGHRFAGEVRDLNSDGQGVVLHPEGRVFFIPGVWRGEQGLFEVTGLKGRLGFARLIELSEASPHRQPAPCAHHGFGLSACGGCPWLFIDYAEQLRAKELQVSRLLQPLNDALTIAPIWGSPEILGYRNRAQLKTDGKRLGYVAANSREIVEISDCVILNPKNRDTLRALRAALPNPNWKPARTKHWTTLDLDDDIDASQVAMNERRPFRQGNSAQNTRMQDWLRERVAALLANASSASAFPIVELFSGSGNFTDVLQQSGCEAITAVDSFRPAIDQLAARQLPGVTTQCANLDRASTPQRLERELGVAKLLVLDPPREGLKNLGNYLAIATQLSAIIYISCNLATLARDLRFAIDKGFRLQQVQPLDLFPQTPHVEVLTVLTR